MRVNHAIDSSQLGAALRGIGMSVASLLLAGCASTVPVAKCQVAARDILGDLLRMEEPRRYIAGMMSGLDTRYDFGDGHPLLGRRIPDLDLLSDGRSLRIYTLLHAARPVLLNLGAPSSIDIARWNGRVRHIDATCAGPWTLPVIGDVEPPTAVLVRPDGYVAWVGVGSNDGLTDALTTWFGPPSAL